MKLLDQVVKLVKERGWSVVNIDAVVIAERPKLKPHITEMSSRMASAIGIAPDAVGVKATTNEGVGSGGTGRGHQLPGCGPVAAELNRASPPVCSA